MFRPGETILICEANQDSGNQNKPLAGCKFQPAYFTGPELATDMSTYTLANADNLIPVGDDFDGLNPGSNLRYRHKKSANVVFCDGHVQSMKKGTVKERNVRMGHPPGPY